jgi:toxin ParE1/3/4
MRKILLSPLAERDLIGIWHYSLAQWGEAQADHYLDELDNGTQPLAENPELGTSREHIRHGYRVLFIKSHAVYYTVTPSAIHVIRVLHVRMDADDHL